MIDIYTIIDTTVGCSQWHLQNISGVMYQQDAHPPFKKKKKCLHKGFIILARQFLSTSE